jgi:hypothetical protein
VRGLRDTSLAQGYVPKAVNPVTPEAIPRFSGRQPAGRELLVRLGTPHVASFSEQPVA